MIDPSAASIDLAKLFARTLPNDEIHLDEWNQQITDVLNVAKSTNSLVCIYADAGAGKTTFLRQLSEIAASRMDIINLTPASPSLKPGWLLHGVSQWLSSDSGEGSDSLQKLSALAESNRPILVCLDSGGLLEIDQMSGEISGMLNLADSCGLRLAILVCCSREKSESISADPQLSNRLVYTKKLPTFNESQLIDFITKRLQNSRIGSGALTAEIIQKFAQEALGSPAQLLRSVSSHLGYGTAEQRPLQKSLQKPTPERNSTQKKLSQKKSGKDINIEELLAPVNKS